MKIQTQFVWLGLLVGGGALASAPVGTFALPHSFQAGTPARASEVNQNFQAIVQELETQAFDLQGVADLVLLENVIHVSPSGGDFSSIHDALASIQDSSESNRYKVVVGPGVYTETDICIVPSFVTLQGAGPSATVLSTARGGADAGDDAAAVRLRSSAVLSDLSVLNAGTGAEFQIGIVGTLVGSLTKIQNVRVEVLGSGGNTQIAVLGQGVTWSLENSDIGVTNGGVRAIGYESTPIGGTGMRSTIKNCRIEGSSGIGEGVGVQFTDDSMRISDSEVIGTHHAIRALAGGSLVLDNCSLRTINASPWAEATGPALVRSLFCSFDGNVLNAIPFAANSFQYTFCAKRDGGPIVNGFSSSVE